jgi:uncharacterized membrane protein YhaH (DUF805 family)
MFDAYKRIFDFQGRAGRKEYWLWFLAYVIQLFVAGVIDNTVLSSMMLAPGIGVFYCLVVLGNLIPALSAGFRRLHDTDRSAWWMLIGLIPFVGAVVLLIFYVLPGTPGPNKFGPPPGGEAADIEETFA